MATTIETTKLYINGQKVFPIDGSSLTADYSDAGYVPNDIQHIQDGYNYILQQKSTDLNGLRNNVDYNFTVWPDLKLEDYEDWQQDRPINFERAENIAFKDGKLEIKNKGGWYDRIIIKNMNFLKEVLIDNIFTSDVILNSNKVLEKATLNIADSWRERINLGNTFSGCENLKEVTLNWLNCSSFKPIRNAAYMFSDCTSLTTINSAFDLSETRESAISFEGCFDNCQSLTNIPTIIAFNKISSSSNMFRNVGYRYIGDMSVQTIDYVIDGLRDPNTGGSMLNGMFKRCPLLRSLTIEGEYLPTDYNFLGFGENWDNGFNFDGATPIYEENSSHIIGYYIPDVYTQHFFNTFRLYVHENNVQTWKDALKNYTSGNDALNWYIDNVMVHSY